MTPAGGRGGTAAARLADALPLFLALLLAGGALWQSPASLLRYWAEIPDYRHGFLLALLSLAWIARDAWSGRLVAGAASPVATILLVPLLLAWLVALRGGIAIGHQLLWPLVMGVVAWAVVGPTAAWRVAPAIGLLYFAIPAWDYAVPLLQQMSIFSTEHMLGWMGISATVSEFRVIIPAGTFEIVEGCSGKRYLVVALAVAYLMVASNGLRTWRAALLLALAAAAALVLNWLRIVIVIYAGHVSGMRHYFVANEHHSLGTALFAVLLLVVLLAGRKITAGAPGQRDTAAANPAGTGFAVWRVACVALLALASLASLHAPRETMARLGPPPVAAGRWQGPLPPQAGWRPHFAGADDEVRMAYASASGIVELYLNVYGNQDNSRELIRYGNNIIAPALWTPLWQEPSGAARGGASGWAEQHMRGPDDRVWLVTYAYLVDGRLHRSGLIAKLAYGWHSLFGAAPSGVLAAAAACAPGNCDSARMLVADFWENMQPSMRALMPGGA